MREIAALFVSWTVGTALLVVLARLDERRLTTEQRARAWPEAARINALLGIGVVFSPLHIVLAPAVHLGRTRRSVVAALLGLVVSALVLAAAEVAGQLVLELPEIRLPADPTVATALASSAEFTLLYGAYWTLRRLWSVDPGGGNRR